MPEKSTISYQVILGDSLTDGGQLKHSRPLLVDASGLSNSPYGRFSDGYTWADDLARTAALDIVKEQFIAYILQAVQWEKINNAEVEVQEFVDYIRAIDLEKFYPDTFSFEELKDSYLKWHFMEEETLIYLEELLKLQGIDQDKGKALLDYVKAIPLYKYEPDEFDLHKLLETYKSVDPDLVASLENMISPEAVKAMAEEVKKVYKTAEAPCHNNIFDAIDYEKFSIKHLNENLENFLYGSFSLGNYQRILFQGNNFVRRFAEGGLSAAHYSPLVDIQAFSLIFEQIKHTIGEFQLSFQYLISFVSQFFMLLGKMVGSRIILSNLEEKVDALLEDDKIQEITEEQKEQTLVTEWTGANDFITMNAFASESVCDGAVQARMESMLRLANTGYKNFLLMDLPDLGKTPRYMNRSPGEREEISRLVHYFNQRLNEQVELIRSTRPDLDIQVFPLSERFDEIYDNPEYFDLPKDIDKSHALLSMKPDEVCKEGHMFWDDVHPSNIMHHVLAQEIYKFAQEHYNLVSPIDVSTPCGPIPIAKGLLTMFEDRYTRAYDDTKAQLSSRFFGYTERQRFLEINFEPTNISEAKQGLARLYQLSKEDKIVRQTMVLMGWLQKNGQLPKEAIAPLLAQAYEMVNGPLAKKAVPAAEQPFDDLDQPEISADFQP